MYQIFKNCKFDICNISNKKMKYLFSKIALPNYLIWLIVIIPSYISKFEYVVYGDLKFNPTYVIIEGLSWFLLAVILTAGIQFAIDIFTDPHEALVRKFIKFGVYVAVATFLFNLVLWPFLTFLFEYYMGKQPPGSGVFGTNLFNWFVWIAWYGVLLFLSLYKEVREGKIRNAELLNNLKESQLNTLKGQINPHFMFNSLNNIRGLMLEDVSKAREMLTRLSESLRYSLTQSDQNSIDLESELEMVDNYIEISKIQFDNRLKFTSDIDSESLNKQIPPMIIQMLIENAIKHGISNLKEGGEVKLLTNVDNDMLLIEVSNTGTLQCTENTTQVGLKNIEKRLELLYGAAATFKLEENNNKVIATIKIPLI